MFYDIGCDEMTGLADLAQIGPIVSTLPKTIAAAKKQYGRSAYSCPAGGGVRVHENQANTFCSKRGMLAKVASCAPFTWYCDPAEPMTALRGNAKAPAGQIGGPSVIPALPPVLPPIYPTPTPAPFPLPSPYPLPYAGPSYGPVLPPSPYGGPLLTPIDEGASYGAPSRGGIPSDIYANGYPATVAAYTARGPLLTPIPDRIGGDGGSGIDAIEAGLVAQSVSAPAPDQPPAALGQQCADEKANPPTVDQFGPMQVVQIVCAQGQVNAPTMDAVESTAMSGLASIKVRGRYIG